MVKKMTNNKKS